MMIAQGLMNCASEAWLRRDLFFASTLLQEPDRRGAGGKQVSLIFLLLRVMILDLV